jgi:hypothetical protein
MQMAIKGTKLVIEIDVAPETLRTAPPSKSGKTRIVATTNGFAQCGPVAVGLNVVVK